MATNTYSGNRHATSSAAPARPPAKPPVKKGRTGRLTGSLIGLSSAAIASVYGVGYLNTQAAGYASGNQLATAAITSAPDGGVAVVAPSVLQQPSVGGGSSVATASNGTTSTSNKAAASSSTGTAATAAYKDGSYTGVGSSRHGSIQATVVIKGGSIVSANVTGCGTRYPCSKVTSLVSQVVSRQSAPVNYVSGATDSSSAYIQAVKSALASAASA